MGLVSFVIGLFIGAFAALMAVAHIEIKTLGKGK